MRESAGVAVACSWLVQTLKLSYGAAIIKARMELALPSTLVGVASAHEAWTLSANSRR